MKVGVVKEIKPSENRVGLTPSGVSALAADGHQIFVETAAGVGSGYNDDAYVAAGAQLGSADEVWAESELLIKVKEPIAQEYGQLRAGQTLFTYLHLGR